MFSVGAWLAKYNVVLARGYLNSTVPAYVSDVFKAAIAPNLWVPRHLTPPVIHRRIETPVGLPTCRIVRNATHLVFHRGHNVYQ